MQQFIKKFSFVLAAAMVLTSVAVPASAEAATKGEVTVKGSAVSSKTVWAGGKSVNFDYKYGKKTSGIKGVWTSNNANIVVNPTSGKVTATGKADGTVTFTPDSKKYKKITVAVKARVRATGLFVREDDKNGQVVSEASVKVGETKKFYVSMSTKLHVKSTYFTHVSASTTAASVTNGANGTSYAGANYGRELTVTGLATGTSVINVSATPYTDDRTSNYDPTPVTLTVKVGEEKVNSAFEQGAKQTGAKQITATGLATTAGVFFVNDNAPSTIIRVEKITADGDAYKFDLSNRLVANAKYSLRDGEGKTLASFVAEGEKATTLTINDGLKISSADAKVAVGSLSLKNQWGEDYSQLTDATTINGEVGFTFLDENGNKINASNAYVTTRNSDGTYYFNTTIDAIENGKKVDTFKLGDVRKVTVVATGVQYTQTASKYLVVDGTQSVSAYTLFDNNFNTVKGKVKNEDLTRLDKAQASAISWNFYLAFPAGTKASEQPTATGAYAVYLVNGSTKTNVTDKLAAPTFDNVLRQNDKANTAATDDVNKEALYSVNLGALKLAKDTTYNFEVVYNGKSGSVTLKSQSFKLTEDSAPAEVKVDTFYYAHTSGTQMSGGGYADFAAKTDAKLVTTDSTNGYVVTITRSNGVDKITAASMTGYETKIAADGQSVEFKKVAPNTVAGVTTTTTTINKVTYTNGDTLTYEAGPSVDAVTAKIADLKTLAANTETTVTDANGNALFIINCGNTANVPKSVKTAGGAVLAPTEVKSVADDRVPESESATRTITTTWTDGTKTFKKVETQTANGADGVKKWAELTGISSTYAYSVE